MIAKGGLDMKKYFSVSFFVIVYAVLFSIGAVCLVNVLSEFFSISLDNTAVPTSVHSFWLFCLAVGFLVLVAFVVVLLLNIRSSQKLEYTKMTWRIQMISAVVIAIPMMKLWELAFKALFDLNVG